MVDVPDKNLRIMGLVTREEFDDLPENIGSKDTVSVYFPMSYQLGGFTFMVSKSKIQPVDMNVEQALKFIFTASVSTDKNN